MDHGFSTTQEPSQPWGRPGPKCRGTRKWLCPWCLPCLQMLFQFYICAHGKHHAYKYYYFVPRHLGPGRPHGWLGSCVVRKPWSIWPRSSPQCRRLSLSWPRAGWQRFAYSFMSCSHYVAKIRGVNHVRYNIIYILRILPQYCPSKLTNQCLFPVPCCIHFLCSWWTRNHPTNVSSISNKPSSREIWARQPLLLGWLSNLSLGRAGSCFNPSYLAAKSAADSWHDHRS